MTWSPRREMHSSSRNRGGYRGRGRGRGQNRQGPYNNYGNRFQNNSYGYQENRYQQANFQGVSSSANNTKKEGNAPGYNTEFLLSKKVQFLNLSR